MFSYSIRKQFADNLIKGTKEKSFIGLKMKTAYDTHIKHYNKEQINNKHEVKMKKNIPKKRNTIKFYVSTHLKLQWNFDMYQEKSMLLSYKTPYQFYTPVFIIQILYKLVVFTVLSHLLKITYVNETRFTQLPISCITFPAMEVAGLDMLYPATVFFFSGLFRIYIIDTVFNYIVDK